MEVQIQSQLHLMELLGLEEEELFFLRLVVVLHGMDPYG
jgi:hypothetical protein